MSIKFLLTSALLAAALIPVADAGAKPKDPDPQMLYQAQQDFFAITLSDQFRTAIRAGDLESMKAMLGEYSIQPAPGFPLEVPPCRPPNYWVNRLVPIYGPNPDHGNTVEWYMGWMPFCERANRAFFYTMPNPTD